MQADSHRAATAVLPKGLRKPALESPTLEMPPKSLGVSRATIGQGAAVRTKRGTVSQAQIADVMGYGQLGSSARRACGPGMPGASLHKAHPRHPVPSTTVSLTMLSVLGLILTQHLSSVITGKRTGLFHTVSPMSEFVTDLGALVSHRKVKLFQFTLWFIQMHRVGHRQRESGDVPNFPEGSLREWVSLLSGALPRQRLTHV